MNGTLWLFAAMKHVICLLVMTGLLAGCGGFRIPVPNMLRKKPEPVVAETLQPVLQTEVLIRPRARPVGFPRKVASAPPKTAETVEEFDTTTQAQREAAVVTKVDIGEVKLGDTIATLGTPTEPGFWLKTPLVTAQAEGRVVFPGTDKSVQVTLIPIDGPPTAGSRLSLAAMRLLEAPLTGLAEIEVFANS